MTEKPVTTFLQMGHDFMRLSNPLSRAGSNRHESSSNIGGCKREQAERRI